MDVHGHIDDHRFHRKNKDYLRMGGSPCGQNDSQTLQTLRKSIKVLRKYTNIALSIAVVSIYLPILLELTQSVEKNILAIFVISIMLVGFFAFVAPTLVSFKNSMPVISNIFLHGIIFFLTLNCLIKSNDLRWLVSGLFPEILLKIAGAFLSPFLLFIDIRTILKHLSRR